MRQRSNNPILLLVNYISNKGQDTEKNYRRELKRAVDPLNQIEGLIKRTPRWL